MTTEPHSCLLRFLQDFLGANSLLQSWNLVVSSWKCIAPGVPGAKYHTSIHGGSWFCVLSVNFLAGSALYDWFSQDLINCGFLLFFLIKLWWHQTHKIKSKKRKINNYVIPLLHPSPSHVSLLPLRFMTSFSLILVFHIQIHTHTQFVYSVSIISLTHLVLSRVCFRAG